MDSANLDFDTPEHHRINDELGSLHVAYKMDAHTIDLISGYFFHKHSGVSDDDGTEYAIWRGQFNRYDTSRSAELRMTSNYSGPINWVAGVVWHDEDNPYNQIEDQGIQNAAGQYVVGGAYQFWYKWENDQQLISRAAFGNLTWDITSRLHFSAGGRYNRSTASYGELEVDTQSEPLPAEPPRASAKLSRFTPRSTLNFDLRKDLTVYAQYATGFRDGYGNGEASGVHDTSGGTFAVPANVQPETVKNYEVGLKSLMLQDRLKLNFAAFYMDYTNLQVYGGYVTDLPDEPSYDLNAGQARLLGGELEATLLPATGLELRLGVGYVDSKIKELDEGGTIYRDIKMPGVRPLTADFVAQYSRPLSNGVVVNYRADWIQQGRSFDDTTTDDPANEQRPYGVLNLSSGFSLREWNVSWYMNNVFDKVYWSGTSTGEYAIHGSFAYFNPRTFGIRVNYHFQ
jgi:iron complex outermembrane receptor protein